MRLWLKILLSAGSFYQNTTLCTVYSVLIQKQTSETEESDARHISHTAFLKLRRYNPFTSESDQFSLSASPEILHQTSWRTWLFIAYSDERWLYNQLSLPHLYISPKRLWVCTFFSLGFSETVNPFTPKNDQFQISPAASLAILHHTVWRTWLFIAYSDERWFYYEFSLLHLYISL